MAESDLYSLSGVDQLVIHQEIDFLEMFSEYETNNKYTIKNGRAQNMYVAIEDNDCLTRYCCGHERPFDMMIMDNDQKEVIHMYRPFVCSCLCCPTSRCCRQNIKVYAPPGTYIGSVRQACSFCKPRYNVENADNEVVLKIKGPYCTSPICCRDVVFKVIDDGEVIGNISKKWAGYVQENYTDADNFGISFPMDLDVQMKAVLMGATFLIDFMFYEKTS